MRKTRSQVANAKTAGQEPSPLRQLEPTKRTRKPSSRQQKASAGTASAGTDNGKDASEAPSFLPTHTPRFPRRVSKSPPVSPVYSPKSNVLLRALLEEAAADPVSPALRGPAESHTLLHLWVDARVEVLASARPVEDPNVTLAVPTSSIPALLAFIAAGNVPQKPGNVLTEEAAVPMQPSAPQKRKLGTDAEMPPARRPRLEASPPPADPLVPGKRRIVKKGRSFSRGLPTAANPRVAALEGAEAVVPTASAPQQEAAPAQEPPARDLPATPVRSWGFGRLIRSARTVTRFLPGLGRDRAGNGGPEPTAGTGDNLIRSSIPSVPAQSHFFLSFFFFVSC